MSHLIVMMIQFMNNLRNTESSVNAWGRVRDCVVQQSYLPPSMSYAVSPDP